MNIYTQDKTLMWVSKETHKKVKENAYKKGLKMYAYLDQIINLGLKAEEEKNRENREE